MDDPQATLRQITANIERVILGKGAEVRRAVLALASDGHLLVEDVPGTGKTMLARALAVSTGCRFSRIQFTPDLLPSDVTGVSVYNQKSGDFEWRPGPIYAQIALADEINRATPKTQSALLEAMEERQITTDGVTRSLPRPFMVIATQNPIEYEGTFPLPEAQLDRFLMRIHVGYPSAHDEIAVLEGQQTAHPIDSLEAVTDAEDLHQLQTAVRAVWVDPLIKQYIVEISSATRQHDAAYLGRVAARIAGAVPRRAGQRAAQRPRLRHARRREGAGLFHAGASHHHQPLGAGAERQFADGGGGRAGPGARPGRAGGCGVSAGCAGSTVRRSVGGDP